MLVELNEEQVTKLCKLVEDDVFTLKNCVVSAVENPGHWEGSMSAAELVKRLRKQEELFQLLRKAKRMANGE